MPGRPPLTGATSRLAPALLGLLALAGCSSAEQPAPRATGPVAVPAPSAPADATVVTACTRLLAALPDEIDPGVTRRPVEDDTGRTAAWGDPPVVLRCGDLPPDRVDEPATVNDVSWSVRDIGAGYAWTTTGLPVTVTVEIPDGYPSPAELVNPLAAPLLSTLGSPTPTATPSSP